MLICDLDGLKEINDGFGHATGDRVLEATADVLRTRVRAGDHVARLGGDEFAVLCPDHRPRLGLCAGGDLRARVSRLGPPEAAIPGATVSIGVACREADDLSAADLVVRADACLYRAKRTGDAVYPDRDVKVA